MDAERAYLFRHALTRDAAYSLQLPGQRAKLHALAAEVIEILFSHDAKLLGSVAAETAEHLHLANIESPSPEGAARELRFAKLAADHAASQFRDQEAAQWWERCAEIALGEERLEALLNAAVRYSGAFSAARADALFSSVLQESQRSPHVQLHAMIRHAEHLRKLGHAPRARSILEQALALPAAAENPDHCSRAQVYLADIQTQTGEIEPAERFYKNFLATRDVRSPNFNSVASNLAALYIYSGRPELAVPTIEQYLPPERAVDNPSVAAARLTLLSMAYVETGRLDEAMVQLNFAYAMHGKSGNRYELAVTLTNIAVVAQLRSNLDEAEEKYLASLELLAEQGERMFAANTLCNLAEIKIQRGLHAQAEALFRDGLEQLRQTDAKRYVGGHTCGLAICLLAMGREEEARGLWKEGAELLRQASDTAHLAQREEIMRQECKRLGIAPLDQPAAEASP